MTSVRLAVAIADAIPHAAAAESKPEAEPPSGSADAAPEPAASPHLSSASTEPLHAATRRGVRGWLSGLLRRPAEYARAYLTASIDHQLRLQAERTAGIAGAAARLEPRLDATLAQAHAQAQRLDGVAAEVDAVSHRLAAVEARQGRLVETLADRETVRAGSAADQIALARRGADRGDEAVTRLDEVLRTVGVLGLLGPRLDELEIKIRPVMEVDAESVAVRTADGYLMLPRSEPLFVLQVANATSGGLEPGVRRVLRALLRPGDACADVGANVGLLTAAMASAVGPTGRVWAFEPEARVRAQLARTLHLNGLAQVSLSGDAVGAEPGRLTFHQSPIIGHSSLYALPDDEQAGMRAVEVEVTTLDRAVPPGTALAAVKIDVEGAELDVLAGMRRVIADSPDLAVVAEFGPSHLHRTGVSPHAWFAAFAAHGLEPRLIAEPGGAVAPTSADALVQVESANLVFVRPGGAADGRLPR